MNTAMAFTEKETADLLRVSRSTLRRMRARGLIKPVYVAPKCPRYTIWEIERFLRSRNDTEATA